LIEMILKENGVGVKQLNPFVKQLVRARLSFANVALLTNCLEDLKHLDKATRVAFIMPLKNLDSKKQRFIESLAINDNVNLQIFEKEVAIVGDSEKVVDYAKLIDFLSQEMTKMHVETIVTKKLTAKEAKEFLELMSLTPKSSTYLGAASGQQLRILASFQFKHLLVLCGMEKEIAQARKILEEMEEKIEDPVEKTIFWYTCKHTQPDELADVLQKVYPQLQEVSMQDDKPGIDPKDKVQREQAKTHADAFIIDPKTSSMIMIVEKKSLEVLKRLIAKLDVPKKMVKIEVLLFEKKTKQHNQIGLASLETGTTVTNPQNGTTFKDGILNFFLSSSQRRNIPAFSFNYQFLLSNQDIQINSAPSVTTMNAVPAVFSLTEEISVAVEEEDAKSKKTKTRYERANFGTTLKITPNVNISEEDQTGYITLETDISFDTINSNEDNKPDVSKKHIENQVRIQDGQTLIIGGLRQKDFSKHTGKIPFLGDIPGIGKLFGNIKSSNNETEMFVFITPRILYDPINDLKKIQKEELQKRPGDVPEFIQQLESARKNLKQKQFEKSMQLLLQ
ncbi:MAG: hypothetical protein K940chlam8_01018, partial [Chlamydiae bacterium]|nr:hypothetical protein [Chlamydiota bacterium]